MKPVTEKPPVIGWPEDSVEATAYGSGTAGTNGFIGIAIGHDSTSAVSGLAGINANPLVAPIAATAIFNNELGFHFAQALHVASDATGTICGNAIGRNIHTGITVSGRF
jgi:3D (Asp-Asp-Asp) domain-containing protein